MKSKPLHCWDCGERVISGRPGSFVPHPSLRQVKFSLTGGAYSESTFCAPCAKKPWTSDRIREFKSAADAVAPSFRAYRITAVDGDSILSASIAGIV